MKVAIGTQDISHLLTSCTWSGDLLAGCKPLVNLNLQ